MNVKSSDLLLYKKIRLDAKNSLMNVLSISYILLLYPWPRACDLSTISLPARVRIFDTSTKELEEVVNALRAVTKKHMLLFDVLELLALKDGCYRMRLLFAPA